MLRSNDEPGGDGSSVVDIGGPLGPVILSVRAGGGSNNDPTLLSSFAIDPQKALEGYPCLLPKLMIEHPSFFHRLLLPMREKPFIFLLLLF